MSIAFYMDVHFPRAVTLGLRLRSIDVLTAQEDGFEIKDDLELLNRATALNRVLVSQDKDLLRICNRLLIENLSFCGLIYPAKPFGTLINDLELVGLISEPSDIRNRIEYFPLR